MVLILAVQFHPVDEALLRLCETLVSKAQSVSEGKHIEDMVVHGHAGHALPGLRGLSFFFFFGSIESTVMGMRYLEKRYLSILFSRAPILTLERKVNLFRTTKYLTHHCDPGPEFLPLNILN